MREGNRIFLITAVTLLSQIVGLATQIVVVRTFGIGVNLDAFAAANTIPQYVSASIGAAIASLLIPHIVRQQRLHPNENSWNAAKGLFFATVILLTLLMGFGLLFRSSLTVAANPGLKSEAVALAIAISPYAWVCAFFGVVLTFISGVFQADRWFVFPMVSSLLGNLLVIPIVFFFGVSFGIHALAFSTALSVCVPTGILSFSLLSSASSRTDAIKFGRDVPGLLLKILPLLLLALLGRSTIPIERYLASTLAVGSIAMIGIINSLLGPLSNLLSVGLSTSIFPSLATDHSSGKYSQFRRRLIGSTRILLFVVLPITTLGFAGAGPLFDILFPNAAASIVGGYRLQDVFRCYVIALPGIVLGTITGRALYSLNLQSIIFFLGLVETVAYFFYARFLLDTFGVLGLGLSYTIFFTLPLGWHVMLIAKRIKNPVTQKDLISIFKMLVVAVVSGSLSYVSVCGMRGIYPDFISLTAASIIGAFSYLIVLRAVGSSEARLCSRLARRPLRLLYLRTKN